MTISARCGTPLAPPRAMHPPARFCLRPASCPNSSSTYRRCAALRLGGISFVNRRSSHSTVPPRRPACRQVRQRPGQLPRVVEFCHPVCRQTAIDPLVSTTRHIRKFVSASNSLMKNRSLRP